MNSTLIRTRFALLSACLAIALATACSNAPSSPSSMSSASAVIAGSVTGDSAAGLAVRVLGTQLSTVVSSSGTFEIAGVPEGTARLQFSKGDVNATADVANVAADQLITLEVQVNGTAATIVKDARSDRKNTGAEVKIKKFTNGEDADFAPGPSIALGNEVRWRYVVTNSGRLSLTNISVVDDQGETVVCAGTGTLASGASMTCSASGVVEALGPYRNVGRVTADFSGPAGSGTVTASDPSHYLGVSPVRIKKFTNGEDADEAPGPSIVVGTSITWRYVVTNIGLTPLSAISVVDDKGVTVVCPSTGTLAAGASMTCSGTGTAVLGFYRNVGRVTATRTIGGVTATVTDSDPSHYLGIPEGSPLEIKKFTNGEDADEAPGPSIVVGTPITWRYVVRNVGNVLLSAVSVTDDKETVLCPGTGTLAPGATLTCSATGTAVLGFYRNVGTVTATRTIGGVTTTITAADVSHYRGVEDEDRTPKVTLCHRTGNGSFHSITVSINAEPAHMAHGDGKPGGPVPGQPGKIFGPTCSIQ